jgi:hypothetical protein
MADEAGFPSIDLPVRPPYPPMEAQAVEARPADVLSRAARRERSGMRKVRRLRMADCVLGGFRYAQAGGEVGSLLLGLEVRYEHSSGGRFRRGTKPLRWRPDKAPQLCTLAQLDGTADRALAEFWGRRAG